MIIMKNNLLLLFLLFSGLGISRNYAQTIGVAAFDKLPADKQLFARDKNKQADITISGKVQSTGYAYVSVVKFRNKARIGYQKAALSYSGSNAPFSLTSKIKAELAEYAFEVYACKSATDSSLIVRRNDILAGDFYLIYGQSNAVAWEVDYTYRNEFCRTYGFNGGGNGWGLSNDLSPRVGIFGIEFQRRVAEKYQIPTCVMNGAMAGASIVDLTGRNPNNHADATTGYGIMLNYAQQSGLLPSLKGIFYWQGEAEAASDDPTVWAPRFDKLMTQLQEDYPMIEKMYVFQLPLFGGGAYDDRIGAFREQQRLLNKKYPIIQPYAALGAPDWNGFHYGLNGYLQVGRDLAEMAGFYHYGAKEKATSPSLQKAFYSTPKKDEVTMVFEDYQQMVYPNDTISDNIPGSQEARSVYSVKDFFYLNKDREKLKAGRAEANRVIVTLKTVANDTTIKYLPSKYHYAGLSSAPWVYIGPFLKNTRGFRAFAFHYNTINPYVDLGTLELTASESKNHVALNWNKLPNVTGYILERLDGKDSLQTHEIMYLPKDQTSYTDLSAKKGVAYTYQIRGYTDKSESAIAYLKFTKESEDVVDETIVDINVYPNPTIDVINVVSTTDKINQIDIFSVAGKKMETRTYSGDEWVTLPTTSLGGGQYILKVHTAEKTSSHKVLVVK
jgi:hypothetical protein